MDNMWEFIQYLYKKFYNIEPRVVDYMAVYNILELCARGYSIRTISKMLKLPQKYIKPTIKEFLNFDGWKEDLDLDTYQRYKSLDGDYHMFVDTVKTTSAVTNGNDINTAFRICGKVEIIRKEIKKYVK